MCGIAGVVVKCGNAAKEVYCGLQRLEYRGYDSAGIAALCDNGGNKKLTVIKRKGRVAELEPSLDKLCGKVAIGHTRWATHGAPCERNAHPHVCGKFAIVHNGIIENYRTLKKQLEECGNTFSSDTDSEVIAVLISEFYEADSTTLGDGAKRILNAVASAVKMLKGAFAIAVMCEDFDGIIAAKSKSNAVIGFFEGGVCLSSDIPALPAEVGEAVVLEDGDLALITAGKTEIFDTDLQPVERIRRHISPMQLSFGKGEYAHFMLKEIYEAERTVNDTAEGFFRTDLTTLRQLLTGADAIIMTGCGTAYNAALAAVRFFAERCGVHCVAEVASELRYSPQKVTGATLLIVVTQSGETADAVGAAEALKEAGAKVVAVTNCGYSAITRIADLVIPVCAGPEICVAATKSYVGQLASLYLIAALAGEDGLNAAQTARKQLGEVARLFGGVHDGDKSGELARDCAKSRAVFFLGRGYDYAAAVEASLKLKEVSYVFSDAYPAGELKHGTLALVDGGTLSIIIVGDEQLADKSESTIEQIISRGGRAAVITCSQSVAARLGGRAKVWLLPQCCPSLSIMLSSVALQLVAYRSAVLLNRNPDKPRNLAKSVTVE